MSRKIVSSLSVQQALDPRRLPKPTSKDNKKILFLIYLSIRLQLSTLLYYKAKLVTFYSFLVIILGLSLVNMQDRLISSGQPSVSCLMSSHHKCAESRRFPHLGVGKSSQS